MDMQLLGEEAPRVAALLRRQLACVALCDSDEAAQRLELRGLSALMATWTVSRAAPDNKTKYKCFRSARHEKAGSIPPTHGPHLCAAVCVMGADREPCDLNH